MREMKDSGIEWIGKIPKGWSVCRVKNFYYTHKDIVGEKSDVYDRLALTLNGVVKRSKDDSVGLQPEAFNGYQILRSNELVFKLIDLANISTSRVGLSPYKGIVSPAYIILSPKTDFCQKFAEYYFLSMWQREVFNHLGDDGVRSSLNASDLLNTPFIYPPITEQKKIVDYLNDKCTEIEAVLEKTRASIDEYKKLKQTVITQAVTKGIRGDRPMKDSGSIWFGNIPVDWDMKKIKYLFHIKKDIAGQEGYTVLSITQKGIVPKDLSKNEGQLAENYSHYQLVNPGDYAMNHMDLLTGWVDISKYTGVTSPDYRVFVLDDLESNNRSFYLYLMQMCYSNRIFYGLGQGVSGMGRWRLQADKFLNFSIVVPSKDEQQEIADYLDAKCAEIDNLISKKEQYINEIENYKKSLIYEYVTGKKEVD